MTNIIAAEAMRNMSSIGERRMQLFMSAFLLYWYSSVFAPGHKRNFYGIYTFRPISSAKGSTYRSPTVLTEALFSRASFATCLTLSAVTLS